MSQATSPIKPLYTTEPVFPLSVEQYHQMIETGVLTDDDPVELIEGVLVFHMPKNPQHRTVNRKLISIFDKLLPPGWFFQSQDPVTLPDGEPEPDGAVVRGSLDEYLDRHPSSDDVAMVIEVADTSLKRDRNAKLRSYARAGIGEYWIVNLESRAIEVYTDPDSAAEPGYRSRVDVPADGRMAIKLDGKVVGEINIASILP
jgi:Uma2 family endonuclease